MSKKMLINATHPEENRVAIVTDGTLSELDIEVVGKEQTKGNIYKGTVVRVESGLQAAFIDYGAERLGFLQMGEIHPIYFKSATASQEQKGRPRINDILHRGQELLLQIVKEERGTKGAALTTFLSLPGRYMVLMPESDTKGISRKIEAEGERKKLKETMSTLELPADIGYIVRTAGIGQTREELGRDLDYLIRLYRNIVALSEKVRAPSLIYRESNLVIRSIRDYFSTDMDEVLIDDPRVFQEAKDFFQQVMPEYAHLVKLHQERRPIFARYQIEEQIETISKNKVALPSGGSIVIDTTEALVAIDVNSGKMASEQGVEATAYKTNLEAAAEIGRQLRLRDLGGLIVIDFIDMRDRQHIRDVENRLKDALKHDKARVTVGRISSQFGLLEMSRQRIKAALAEGTYNTCPHCSGTGRIKSIETQAIAFLRKVYGGIARGQIGRIDGEVPLDVATYLLNAKREEILELERQRNVSLYIKGRPDFMAGQAELLFQKREKDEKEEIAPLEFTAAPPSQPERSVIPTAAATEPAVETVAEKGPEGESEVKKKRRRRRKKSSEESAAAPAQAAQEESEQSETFAEMAAEAPETGAEEPGEKPVTAPKKRSRRRRKPSRTAQPEGIKAEAQEPAAPVSADAVKPVDAPAEVAAVLPVKADETPATPAAKKKRRRPGRKPAASTPDSAVTAPRETGIAQSAAPSQSAPETVVPVQKEETPHKEAAQESPQAAQNQTSAAPKRPARRRTTKAAEKEKAGSPTLQESEPKEKKSASASEETTTKKSSAPRAPRKTSAKKAAAKTPTPTAQPTSGDKTDEPPVKTDAAKPEGGGVKPAEKKPTRKRKPPVKKKTEPLPSE